MKHKIQFQTTYFKILNQPGITLSMIPFVRYRRLWELEGGMGDTLLKSGGSGGGVDTPFKSCGGGGGGETPFKSGAWSRRGR